MRAEDEQVARPVGRSSFDVTRLVASAYLDVDIPCMTHRRPGQPSNISPSLRVIIDAMRGKRESFSYARGISRPRRVD